MHQKLQQDLVYYRVGLKQSQLGLVASSIADLLSRERMESLRAFVIFGPTDLLFRVWIHRNIESTFRYKLSAALGSNTPEHFTVQRFVLKSYERTREDTKEHVSLDEFILDAQTVQALQLGTNQPMVEQLQAKGLLRVRPEHARETIRFFVAVHVPPPADDKSVNYVADLIADEIQARRPIIMPAVYVGDGFCNILIKGEVEPDSYFAVGQLTRWLSKQFWRPHMLFTETHLVDSPEHLIVRPDVIDDRTFIEIRGRDPLVEAIIPEVFTVLSPRSDEIFRFIADRVKGLVLLLEERRLLHDYLVGYLLDKEELSKIALILYATGLEATVRKSVEPFIQRNGLDRAAVYTSAKLSTKDSTKHMSLGDLLFLAATAIEIAGKPTTSDLRSGWQDLANLRNQPAHGSFNPSKWREHVQVLLDNFGRARELVGILGPAPDPPGVA